MLLQKSKKVKLTKLNWSKFNCFLFEVKKPYRWGSPNYFLICLRKNDHDLSALKREQNCMGNIKIHIFWELNEAWFPGHLRNQFHRSIFKEGSVKLIESVINSNLFCFEMFWEKSTGFFWGDIDGGKFFETICHC